MVVQPGAMALVAWTWTWPSVIWLARSAIAEQGMLTVTEIGIVVDGPLLEGAVVGAGLPGIGAVVVVVWPAWTGDTGAGVTIAAGGVTTTVLLPAGGATTTTLLPAGDVITTVLLPAGGATTTTLLPAGGAITAGLLPAGVETGVGMSCTDLVTMTGCWGMCWAQRPW